MSDFFLSFSMTSFGLALRRPATVAVLAVAMWVCWPAQAEPRKALRDCPFCPELVLIPGGMFAMGLPDRAPGPETLDDDARPRHDVTIPGPFHLGKYAITRGPYAAFVRATGPRPFGTCWAFEKIPGGMFDWKERKDRDWQHPGFVQTDRDPVVCVDAADAQDYAAWLSRETKQVYRLPSEAEWEYAARGGTTGARYWGDNEKDICRYANLADRTLARVAGAKRLDPEQYGACSDRFAYTAPVGSFRPNGFGLYDMLGNVWQTTADPWHDNYQGAPSDGSVWALNGMAGKRVLRGGSWGFPPSEVGVNTRFMGVTRMRMNTVGFRLVRNAGALD